MIRTLCFAAGVALGIVNLPQPDRGPSAFDAIVVPFYGAVIVDAFDEEFRDI